MRRTVAPKLACLRRGLATTGVALAAAGLLAACTTSVSDTAGKIFGQDKPDDIPQEYFLKQSYCPPVSVRAGTEAMATYERGHEAEPSFVKYQASITRTARECAQTADGLAIKVGIAGRVVSGPKGGPGEVTLPIRVVVTKQNSDVLFSQLFKVPVSIVPPNLGTNFRQVVPQVAVPLVPGEGGLLIHVGFDEGKTS